MATNVFAVGRRILVWMVVIASGIESLANTAVATLHRDGLAAVVWLLAGSLMMLIGASIESVKAFLEA